MLSQEKQILNYLLSGKSLTPIEALNKFGCFRLSARIWDLRNKGYKIITDRLCTPSGKMLQIIFLNKNNFLTLCHETPQHQNI